MATTPPRLDKGLLSDQIYAWLKRSINDLTFEPGDQLVESKLARDMAVSQAPVREAIKRLAHEGLVTHVRHQGNFVTIFTPEEAAQARVARAAVESLAGSLLCGGLTDEVRSTLGMLIADMHGAADTRDIASFRDLDFAFHRTVIENTGNPYLPRMWDLLEPSLRSMHVLSDPGYEGDWHLAAESHRKLVNDLDGPDADVAADSFRQHALGGALKRLAAEAAQTSSPTNP